jgi:hypothetical protein
MKVRRRSGSSAIPVAVARRRHGERAGPLAIVAHFTPGHTAGGTQRKRAALLDTVACDKYIEAARERLRKRLAASRELQASLQSTAFQAPP